MLSDLSGDRPPRDDGAARGRAGPAGADVHPQVTCLPLTIQLRMDNPYYFRTVPIFLELLGHPTRRSSRASTATPRGGPKRPVRCPT